MPTENLSRQQKIASFFDSQSRTPQAMSVAAQHLWAYVESSLLRMIGPIGVASLFERCVELNKAKYLWLPADKFSHFTEVVAYQLVWNSLDTQPVAIAKDASIALFSTLFELLTLLIGERLTARVFSVSMQGTDPSGSANNDKAKPMTKSSGGLNE